MIPVLADEAQHDDAGQNAGDAGDAEVDEDALGDLADRDVDDRPGQPEKWRQNRDEQPRIDAEEQHLKDRIEGNQTGRVLGRALGDLVPDDDHGDAARQTDHDQADHVFRLVGQKDDGQREHQERPDDPVLEQRQAEDLAVGEDIGQFLVAHLGERRIHHQDQAQGNRDVGRADLEGIDEILGPRHEVAERDAQPHGGEDPDRQITVEKREFSGDLAHAPASSWIFRAASATAAVDIVSRGNFRKAAMRFSSSP